jgi:hypothetical protein
MSNRPLREVPGKPPAEPQGFESPLSWTAPGLK